MTRKLATPVAITVMMALTLVLAACGFGAVEAPAAEATTELSTEDIVATAEETVAETGAVEKAAGKARHEAMMMDATEGTDAEGTKEETGETMSETTAAETETVAEAKAKAETVEQAEDKTEAQGEAHNEVHDEAPAPAAQNPAPTPAPAEAQAPAPAAPAMQETEAPKHEHTWHEHYATRQVLVREAWVEEEYVGDDVRDIVEEHTFCCCGADITGDPGHGGGNVEEGHGGWVTRYVVVGQEAVPVYVPVFHDAEYKTEQYVNYVYCDCGARK